ncbi:SPX-domain-containing protein [Coprinellus micaceus]|uniref:SPX-domain-containing protein n=1 Tax=Coprinellus micaceus TaxID=71717 RepID=A0A4Y7TBN6_COPMI|nr:SPX-domain-containing protein [Coprinellus micaceus]
MKFSSSLKFNAISDWWDDYIAYDALKKYIYQLEKQQVNNEEIVPHDLEAGEGSALLGGHDATVTDAVFIPLLDEELRKIVFFYEMQEKEFFEELEELEEAVQKQEEADLTGAGRYTDLSDGEDDDDDEDSISRSRPPRGWSARRPTPDPNRRQSISSTGSEPGGAPSKLQVSHSRKRGTSFSSQNNPEPTIWTARSDYAYDTRLLFKRRITNLYIHFTNLKSYVELNYSGFRKIIKKYDKVTYSELKDRYLHDLVERAHPFTPQAKDRLNHGVNTLIDLYCKCVTRGDRSLAKEQLKLHQRENIAWERDTVWRQMIGRERRGDGLEAFEGATLVKPEEPPVVKVKTPIGPFMLTKRKIRFLLSIILFFVLVNIPFVQGKEANNCIAILTFLCIRKEVEPGVYERLSTHAATTYVFSIMFSPTIMLLIGGFTISSALSKTNIDRVIFTRVLYYAGTKPKTVILAFMFVSCFASMLISNVAAPTLCFTLIRPILRTLPPKSNFAPCLILAIALAANIGGQSSPISSPQNLIAIGEMDPTLDWSKWFAVALPVSGISIVLIWLLLLASYDPARAPDGEGEIELKAIRPTKEAFTMKQYWVAFVTIVTIAFWCVEHEIEDYVGDMGVIALFPIVAFFSTGVLKKDDFEKFAWSIVFLAMGGIALGKGVVSSGLFSVLDAVIRRALEGFSTYAVVLILSPIVLIISTFISHTIASVLLVPIAQEVGTHLPGQPVNLLIFITALICSAGMGMPVSGFPNQTAATQEDELGNLYLTNMDFLKNGVPASIIATLVVSTVGYALMRVVGHVAASPVPPQASKKTAPR